MSSLRTVPQERTHIPSFIDCMNLWLQKISLMAPKLLSLIQRFLGLNLKIQLPPRYLQGSSVPHVTKTVLCLTDPKPVHCLDIQTLSNPNENQVVILNFFSSHLPSVPLLINVKSLNSSNPTVPLHGHCPTQAFMWLIEPIH